MDMSTNLALIAGLSGMTQQNGLSSIGSIGSTGNSGFQQLFMSALAGMTQGQSKSSAYMGQNALLWSQLQALSMGSGDRNAASGLLEMFSGSNALRGLTSGVGSGVEGIEAMLKSLEAQGLNSLEFLKANEDALAELAGSGNAEEAELLLKAIASGASEQAAQLMALSRLMMQQSGQSAEAMQLLNEIAQAQTTISKGVQNAQSILQNAQSEQEQMANQVQSSTNANAQESMEDALAALDGGKETTAVPMAYGQTGEQEDSRTEQSIDGLQQRAAEQSGIRAGSSLEGDETKNDELTEEQQVSAVSNSSLASGSTEAAAEAAEPKQAEAPQPYRQISDKILEHLDKGEKEFSMQLEPEHLGKIDVKLIFKAGKLAIEFAAESMETHRLLASQADRLIRTLGLSNVHVEGVQVQSTESSETLQPIIDRQTWNMDAGYTNDEGRGRRQNAGHTNARSQNDRASEQEDMAEMSDIMEMMKAQNYRLNYFA